MKRARTRRARGGEANLLAVTGWMLLAGSGVPERRPDSLGDFGVRVNDCE